jgi:hypothetical protein
VDMGERCVDELLSGGEWEVWCCRKETVEEDLG